MDFRVCARCGGVAGGGEAQCLRCGGALRYTDARSFVGQTFGKYELLDVIGRGGMGVVLKGRHVTLGHLVAVKLLLPGLGDPAFGERFLREAKLLAGLRHPNIVEVHDFDIAPGGVAYYVMEFLHGETLAAELARAPHGLGWPRTQAILRGVADALDTAHARGVVHRDLKPDNVFIARDGSHERIKLLDFGIARALDEADAGASLTQTGHVIGTPRYFAPEQFYGYPVTTATDQYALALLVAEMASGAPLRSAQALGEVTLEGIGRVRETLAARLPRDTPRAHLAVLERALATDPARRFASVAEFAQALGIAPALPAAQTSPGAAATKASPAPPAASTRTNAPSPSSWRFAALAAVALALLIGVGFWHLRSSPALHATGAADTAGAASAPAGQWLRPRDTLSVPIDAQRILARVGDVVVLASADGWYLRALQGEAEASRVVLPPGRRLLGALEGGRLAALDAEALLSIDPIKGGSATLARLPKDFSRDARAWIAPDARTLVVAQGGALVVYRVENAALRRVGEIADASDAQAVSVTRTWIAAVVRDASRLRVYRTADAALVIDEALDAGQVRDLRVLDAPPRVAVASYGPEVRVFALDASAPPRAFSVQRGAQALAWLADFPTLLVAGESGLALWRDDAFVDERHADAGLPSGSLYADGYGVLALDSAAHRLARFDYGTLPIASQHVLGKDEAWAVHVDAGSGAVYVGSRDGVVHALRDGKVGDYPLHADGVTALAGDAEHLASASDDRTLAIRHLPDMTVQWRSRGHDYLVNQLQLQGASLWSSSSDGTLKRWRWPTLEEEEGIDLRALSGGNALGLHAFQVDAAATHALVGTWNHRLLALEREPGAAWKIRTFPIESSGGYHVLDLPQAGLQLVQGTEPTRLYAYDAQSHALYDVPDFGADYGALTADDSGSGAFAAGVGVVAHYVLSRDADGAPRWQVSLALRSGLGAITAADYDAQRHRLWAADENGRLLSLDTATWRLPPPHNGLAMRRDAPR